MTGPAGQFQNVESRFKRNFDRHDREPRMRNGNVSMTNSTTPSRKPSLPVTRYRLFKSFIAIKSSRPDLLPGQLNANLVGTTIERLLAFAWRAMK
jgi:hypothetical protein